MQLITNFDIFIIFLHLSGIACNLDNLELVMPRYAIRGGDVALKCHHNLTPEQLNKVEWQKNGNKMFQYIKGRQPAFRYFNLHDGIIINKTLSSDKQLHLSRLDFSASGSYSCVVSMENPLFTKESEIKDLTVIEPQETDPEIKFNKATYEIGDILEANCTSGPARPTPHITWLINNEKVNDALTKSFSNGAIGGHGLFKEQKLPAIKQLSIEVSELHVGDDGELRLTCMSTIPAYVNPKTEFADERRTSVKIEIVMTEGPVEAISNSNNNISSNCSNQFVQQIPFYLCSLIIYFQYY